MFLRILILEFKHAPLICVDDMGILIFVITLMLPSVCHMDVAVDEEFRPVFFQKRAEDLEPLMGEVASVIELVCGRVGDQNVEPSSPEKLEP